MCVCVCDSRNPSFLAERNTDIWSIFKWRLTGLKLELSFS